MKIKIPEIEQEQIIRYLQGLLQIHMRRFFHINEDIENF